MQLINSEASNSNFFKLFCCNCFISAAEGGGNKLGGITNLIKKKTSGFLAR